MANPLKRRSRISVLREQAGLTQKELSHAVGVTEATIANWEKDRGGIDWFERIARLCNILGCLPGDLVEYHSTNSQYEQLRTLSFTEVQELIGSAAIKEKT